MVCIYCGKKTQVVNSRNQKKLNQTWRRRKCPSCKNVFSTIERINLASSLVIKNRTNKIEGFQREKLFLSIYESLGHRKNPIEDSAAITDTVVSNLLERIKSPLIERSDLIKTCLVVIKNFDKTGAVHYAAYHPVIRS